MPLLELPNGAHIDFETIEVSSARLKAHAMKKARSARHDTVSAAFSAVYYQGQRQQPTLSRTRSKVSQHGFVAQGSDNRCNERDADGAKRLRGTCGV